MTSVPNQHSQTAHRIPYRRWLGALGAALAMQIVAAFAVFGALIVAYMASTTGFFGAEKEPEISGWFVLPLLAIAVGCYIGSGAVASRVLGDKRGWLALIVVPALCWISIPLIGAF